MSKIFSVETYEASGKQNLSHSFENEVHVQKITNILNNRNRLSVKAII